MHDADTQIETDREAECNSKASLTPEILGEHKDNQHKAQISSTSLLSYCTVV